ncbi:MAG: SAM-dependent chlorinase/fluorinase, partial [bacterium]|nr:SAM-dependent chlorinase/fluorinase [bacterium]
MPIITLTSDWGLKDHYLAVVKASIYSQLSDVNIVDISHLIPQYDIAQASYVVKNTYSYFPKGSIHIIGVNTVASIETHHVGVYVDGHYFIGADNG